MSQTKLNEGRWNQERAILDYVGRVLVGKGRTLKYEIFGEKSHTRSTDSDYYWELTVRKIRRTQSNRNSFGPLVVLARVQIDRMVLEFFVRQLRSIHAAGQFGTTRIESVVLKAIDLAHPKSLVPRKLKLALAEAIAAL